MKDKVSYILQYFIPKEIKKFPDFSSPFIWEDPMIQEEKGFILYLREWVEEVLRERYYSENQRVNIRNLFLSKCLEEYIFYLNCIDQEPLNDLLRFIQIRIPSPPSEKIHLK